MIKKIGLLLAAIAPLNRLRIFLYRALAGYKISYDSWIGSLNYIDLTVYEIDGGRIGHLNIILGQTLKMASGSIISRFNRFNNVNNVILNSNSHIATRNRFAGTPPGLTPFKEHENITLGEDSNITAGHLFDLSDSITIGRNVTFGGRGTEVWTHGFDLNHVKIQAPVTIGDGVYVGSHCIFIQGIRVTGGVSIGAGTVVAKSIADPGFYVSSQLIKKSIVADYSKNDEVITHKNFKFVRK